ncbi:MAG: hypothetical protein K8R87_03370 [Verrucomicrobia bacterium]|nr:hypothetical protein [Verrucomicrobiota bacterium]
MALTNEELIGFRQNRRKAIFRVASVFISLLVVAIMVFLVLRLVKRHSDIARRAEDAAERERQEFEANATTATPRVRRDDLPAGPRPAPREITPNVDILDMTVKSSIPRSTTPLVDGIPSEKSIENLDQKQAAIAEVLRQFFEARTVTQLIPLVRDSRRVRALMEEYHQRVPLKSRAWKGIGWSMPVEEPGYRFAYVQATFQDLPPMNLVVEETSSGFLVDWESSVQYSELGWKEFMATKPVQPKTFRVIASRAGGGATNAVVLTLKHPHEEGLLTGRFDPADPRFSSLMEQLEHSKWKDVPVILRLCYSGSDAPSDEVQIVGVEGKGWLILGERDRGL